MKWGSEPEKDQQLRQMGHRALDHLGLCVAKSRLAG